MIYVILTKFTQTGGISAFSCHMPVVTAFADTTALIGTFHFVIKPFNFTLCNKKIL